MTTISFETRDSKLTSRTVDYFALYMLNGSVELVYSINDVETVKHDIITFHIVSRPE